MLDDSESEIKIIERLLRKTKIELTSCSNVKEFMNNIKSKEKFNLIIINEEVGLMSANDIIKKILLIRNFNTPVILLTRDNKYEYTEEYKEAGFKSVLLKPIDKLTFIKLINEAITIKNKK